MDSCIGNITCPALYDTSSVHNIWRFRMRLNSLALTIDFESNYLYSFENSVIESVVLNTFMI